MLKPPARRIAWTALSVMMTLLLVCVTPARVTQAHPTQAHLAAPTHLLVKLPLQLWTDPAHALSPYAFEQWTPLLVPGWIRGTLSQEKAARSISEMNQDPNVLAVQEDGTVHAALAPNDPYWEHQWGPQKVNAPDAWTVTTGESSVTVAILDTGADVDHSDLADQLWVNTREVPGNGLDDDGNGYVDDIND